MFGANMKDCYLTVSFLLNYSFLVFEVLKMMPQMPIIELTGDFLCLLVGFYKIVI